MTTNNDILAPEPATAAPSMPPAPPRPETTYDEAAAEQDRDDAFSDAPAWNGRTLQPFSIERFNIFVTQRLAMGAPAIGEALRDGAAFYPDAQRILWLCSHGESAIQSLRRDPAAMQTAVEQWAATHVPIPRSAEAVNIALRIFNSAYETRHQPRPADSRYESGN